MAHSSGDLYLETLRRQYIYRKRLWALTWVQVWLSNLLAADPEQTANFAAPQFLRL